MAIGVICVQKESKLSKVTLKMLGLLTVGIGVSSPFTLSCSLTFFIQVVKKVAVDLVRESLRFLAVKKRDRLE